MFVLIPNQHIGCWETGFAPQWIVREYLARRGSAVFPPERLSPARCPLLGYAPNNLLVEGTEISRWFLRVETQPEVGEQGYDAGAAWEDFKVGMEHFSRWERVAVITDTDWIKHSVQLFSFIMPGTMRVYPTSEATKARLWITQAA